MAVRPKHLSPACRQSRVAPGAGMAPSCSCAVQVRQSSASLTSEAQLVDVTKTIDGQSRFQPQFLPDGRHFLYYVAGVSAEANGIYVASLEDDAPGQAAFARYQRSRNMSLPRCPAEAATCCSSVTRH